MSIVLMDAEKAKIIKLNLQYALRQGRTELEVYGNTITVEYAERILNHWKEQQNEEA